MLQANKKTDTIGGPLNKNIISQIEVKDNDTLYRWFVCYINFGSGGRIRTSDI